MEPGHDHRTGVICHLPEELSAQPTGKGVNSQVLELNYSVEGFCPTFVAFVFYYCCFDTLYDFCLIRVNFFVCSSVLISTQTRLLWSGSAEEFLFTQKQNHNTSQQAMHACSLQHETAKTVSSWTPGYRSHFPCTLVHPVLGSY